MILDDEENIKRFTSNFLLTLLKYVKTQNAKKFVICVRKTLQRSVSAKFDKSLRLIGFKKMDTKNQNAVFLTETHSLYSIVIEN